MIDENDVTQYIARQLLMLRQSAGISQKRLGEEMNLAAQQIQKYERGHNRMSAGKLFQFAEAFDVSVLMFYPERGDYHSAEPLPLPTMRIIKLLPRIPDYYYDEIYQIIKSISRITARGDVEE